MGRLINEEIDKEIDITDHPLWVKSIDYEEGRNCNNCQFSSGPKDDLECKSPAMKRMIKAVTLNIMVSGRMVCNYWRKF